MTCNGKLRKTNVHRLWLVHSYYWCRTKWSISYRKKCILSGHNFTGRGILLRKSKTPLEILINTHQLNRSSSISSQICSAKHKDNTKRNSISDKITCWKREMPSKISQFVNVSIATLTNLSPAPKYNLDYRCSKEFVGGWIT